MGALFDPKTTAPRRLAEIEYSARLLGVRLTTHRVERKEDIPAAMSGRRPPVPPRSTCWRHHCCTATVTSSSNER
jgi:hypothetical protein